MFSFDCLRTDMKSLIEGYKKGLTDTVRPLITGLKLYQSMGDKRQPIACGIIQDCRVVDLLEYEDFRIEIITDKKTYYTFARHLFNENKGYGYFVEKI